ncbi:MAG: hypothetical protein WCN27_05340, partial [Alphaproteobacteria bacterium]
MGRTITIKGFSFLVCFFLFSATSAGAAFTLSDDEIEDRKLTPFSWQNEKHYRDLKKNLQALSEQQLNLAVQVLSKSIRLQKTFFKQRYDNLLSHLSRTIYKWM